MRKIIIGIVVGIIAACLFFYIKNAASTNEKIEADSALIEKEIKNVSKLIVTEGYYAQVFTYKNNESLFFGLVPTEKKALVSVNTKALVTYDLAQINYEIEEQNKTLKLIKIPESQLEIFPEFEFYDVSQDYLNQFKAEDFNKMKEKITLLTRKKIETSEMMKNADNRLVSELQKLFILTNSLGWTLEYNQQPIDSQKEFEILLN
ncbi:DUF4230 domain-containing protein [Mesonia sp. K7]|uniref:DUF4230 domain-containing protein n=1 Tax=Mesonia sp. K7 TaxID=2218606 RepID=UPI000DA88B9C|nr:DUF4230 domain-containing protein [Mesonia sp. K7]PZD78686.1 hypothetical protein DNG35_04335 [Mesonia sp. K7]